MMAALADVDAGHVIDHQAVQAWSESLSTDNPLPGEDQRIMPYTVNGDSGIWRSSASLNPKCL